MLHQNRLLCAALSVTFSAGFAGFSASAQAAVVTSLKPLGFIASAVADGVTGTQVLLPDGASEHGYALKPSGVKRLQKADLVVWIGPEMETFMRKSLSRVPAQKQLAVAELQEVKPLLMKGADDNKHEEHAHPHTEGESDGHHHHGEYNMHLWLSPDIARLAAVAIHGKLVELMPQSRVRLDANLQRFGAALERTSRQVNNRLAPLKGKGYFVFHDAWGYFEKQYGLASLGHFTVNPEIPPGARRLHQIRTQLAEHKAVCIFAEPQFRPAVMEAVARGTGVRMGTLDPLGTRISLGKESYMQFLTQVANQYSGCLKGD